jgi:hypothetical protein
MHGDMGQVQQLGLVAGGGGGSGGGSASDTGVAAAALQAFSLEQLERCAGRKTGAWLYRVCRGVDDEAVKERDKSKSCLAFKSFAPVPGLPGLQVCACKPACGPCRQAAHQHHPSHPS